MVQQLDYTWTKKSGCKGLCLHLGIVLNKRSDYFKNLAKDGGRYHSGKKYCSKCEHFVKWNKAHCPCCGASLRNGPRDRRGREKAREIGRI